MKLFRNYTMRWWQVGLLKTYTFVVGIIVGVYFADFFTEWLDILFTIFAVLAVYFTYLMFAREI